MEQLLERINKASLQVKLGGLAGAILVITALNFFLFVQGMEEKITGNEEQLTRLQQTLAEKQAIAQNLAERRKELNLLNQKLAEALTELPEEKEIDELLAQLNDVGKKAGLEISKVEPQPEASAGFYAKIPIKMAVSGNYHEVAMFLQELASMRRIVNVDNIKLTQPTMKNDKVVLASDFQATTFRFLDQAANAGQPVKDSK